MNAPGLLVIGYRSNPSKVALTPEKFDTYLKEEGLDAMAAVRARRGRPGDTREMFSRCAKSLVLAGSTEHRRTAIACSGSRSSSSRSETLTRSAPVRICRCRLTYEGRPLAGALVVAINRSAPGEKLAARSDRTGRVTFRLPEGGMWLIKAVHMIPARADIQADWESFWASLTFELPVNANATAVSTR